MNKELIKNLKESDITIENNAIYVNNIGYVGTYWNFDNSITLTKEFGGNIIKCNEYEIKEIVRLWFVNELGE